MNLIINGQERVSEAVTLADLWQAETADLPISTPQGFAIALNGSVVRRAAWTTTTLNSGDRIEIIRAMAGG